LEPAQRAISLNNTIGLASNTITVDTTSSSLGPVAGTPSLVSDCDYFDSIFGGSVDEGEWKPWQDVAPKIINQNRPDETEP